MSYKNINRLYFLLISLLILLLDQLTKFLIKFHLDASINRNYILFNIDYIKNYGAAFNIFSGSRIFLSLISIVFSLILIYLILFKNSSKYIDLFSYAFLLGGTLGNGIDRIFNGYVVDFINLNFIKFPVFNIADISINIGFILILYSLVIKRK